MAQHWISLSEELGKGVAGKRLLAASDGGGKLFLIALAAGGGIPEHSAPRSITVHCVEGEIDFAVEGVWRAMRPGDLVMLDAQTPHALRTVVGGAILLHVL